MQTSTTKPKSSFPPSSFSFGLALALGLAACASSSGSAAPDPAAPLTTGPTSSASPAASTGAPPPSAAMPPLVNTQYVDALAGLGLNANDLPTMDKLTPEQVRNVMSLFTKSLGVDCKFCHQGGNFKAPTPHKKVAERMWNEWVHGKKLASASGPQTPVFCDSCHQGKAEFLDKSNHEQLAHWMKAEFVDRLHPTDGAAMSCETCHGKPFDGDFLEKWEKL